MYVLINVSILIDGIVDVLSVVKISYVHMGRRALYPN